MVKAVQRFGTFFVAFAAIALMMVALCACGAKEISVTIVDGDETIEVTTQDGTTVSDILSEADITVNDDDVVTPALDTKVEGDGQTITIERMNSVVVVVDGEEVDIDILGGTVQDALDQAEVTLADGDTVDVELTDPLADELVITVTRAPKVEPTVSSSNNNSSSAPAPSKSIVSKTKVPNCSGDGHGYYEITWSDGSVTTEEY